MSRKTYQVSEVARLAKVTVRTLHHYHDIGLLVPSSRTAAGYRLYGEDDLLRLQQILVARELGLALEPIRRMLDEPGHDRERTLREHRELLLRRRRATEEMIRSVDAALETLRGERIMSPETIFDGFDPVDHEEEARRRWGETRAYREAARRTGSYGKEDWARIRAENDALMAAFAECLAAGVPATDARVLELAEGHRRHLDRWYYPCSRRMHVALAEMYVADPRFTAAFEKIAAGLTEYLAQAVRANAAGGS